MADFGMNRRQRRFVAALISTSTIEEAARAAGIGERTAYRYLKDPAVRRALGAALDAIMGQTMRAVADGMTEAAAALQAIVQDEEAAPGVRVTAARALLDAGPKLWEVIDLSERLGNLEDRIWGIDDEEAS